MIWKPGDRAIVDPNIKPAKLGKSTAGETVTLIKYLGDYFPRKRQIIRCCWRVQLMNGSIRHVTEPCLLPIDDGREKSTWSECVWKPKGVEA